MTNVIWQVCHRDDYAHRLIATNWLVINNWARTKTIKVSTMNIFKQKFYPHDEKRQIKTNHLYLETQIKYCENWWVNLCPYNTRVSLGLFREWNNSIWCWSRQWSICFSSEKLPSSDPRLQSAQNGSVILVPRFVNTNKNLFGSLWFGKCTQNWYFLSKLDIPLISRDMCDF